MEITLFTTHCPRCKVLAKKLEQKGLKYNEVTDVEYMQELGFTTTPMLAVDCDIMDFKEAVDWLNTEV